ncbi:glucose 1-dehydrogenase [Paenibacillus aurantius]|uniref:Glucose 1-dehydrogenase n=1 Tax=Paenibacillus aurantius TaxID=2918900 RepID=A0AA96RID0_9BACL|nr:glucose 1-dehydrogenase [Paenibacillus aurantius]WNQ14293.1 glucose 1-dehydrogenase [Paenibacillus aurantius]
MAIDFTGRIALVTGSSGGIGRACALMLAKAGAKVAVNGLTSMVQAEEVAEEIRRAGGEAAVFQADVTKPDQIEAMIEGIRERLGGSVDILVNNAGHLIKRVPNAEMTEEHYTRVMDVNLKSTAFVTKAVLAGMKAKGGGRIINMTSVAAHNGGGAGAALYAAGKAAVIAYSKGLAKEVAGDGITVNCVSPGFIGNTAFHSTFTPDAARQATINGIPLGREGHPDDVAGAVVYLASDLASYLTGETIEVNGGMFMR